ncbi:unnamed protein product [Cyprideis torosa]|uniref:Uncharacterized protein n=1 Tax=Cyprideis torosa TaxID=163714 RepID=A0A7R8W480_9CRUS|nr:unnamed protein product [Cyprideis torosa]CAG0883897.1 unnamed protein product [Cyprideis torosa]
MEDLADLGALWVHMEDGNLVTSLCVNSHIVFFKRSRLSPFQWFSITLRFLHWEVILSSPKEGLLLRHGQDFSMVGEEGFLNVRLKGRAVWDFEDFQTVAGCIHFQSRYGQTPFAWFSFPSKGPLRLSVWSDKGNAIVLLSPVATKDWERFLKFMKVVVVTDKGSLYIMNGTFDPSDHLSKAYIPSSRFQDDWWHFWITADPQTLAVGWGESSILPLMTSEVSRDEVRYYAPLSSLDMNWVINCGPSVLPIPPPPMASLSWSAWSPWNCSVPCGGGPGIQTRTCFSNVEDCPGPSNRTGLCNEEPCIKLTSNMLQNIQHRLSVTYNNLVLVSPGSPFRFSCESQVAQTVFQYYPDPKMRIFHLDTMLVEFKSHKSPEEEEHEIPEIPRTVASDAGVYHCWLQASPGQKSVLLNIATLQFQTSETSVIHAPSTSEAVTARFRSFSSYFQGFLSPIRVTWLHEGSAWATATSKHASQLDVFELEVNEKMRGIWESVVEDTYSGRKWLTNRFFFEPKGQEAR